MTTKDAKNQYEEMETQKTHPESGDMEDKVKHQELFLAQTIKRNVGTLRKRLTQLDSSQILEDETESEEEILMLLVEGLIQGYDKERERNSESGVYLRIDAIMKEMVQINTDAEIAEILEEVFQAIKKYKFMEPGNERMEKYCNIKYQIQKKILPYISDEQDEQKDTFQDYQNALQDLTGKINIEKDSEEIFVLGKKVDEYTAKMNNLNILYKKFWDLSSLLEEYMQFALSSLTKKNLGKLDLKSLYKDVSNINSEIFEKLSERLRENIQNFKKVLESNTSVIVASKLQK